MVKKDPHNHERKYNGWKEKVANGIPGISKANSDLIKKFMRDMELGLNVSVKSKKGSRSYIRLNTLRDKMMFFARHTEDKFNLNCITEISEDQIHTLIADMRSGAIQRANGQKYKGTGYFVKNFKAFWHWYMLIMKKEGKDIQDITTYLDSKTEKPEWVYLTEEDVKKLANKAKYEYRVLIWFLYDTGIRSPTEMVNVKVGDLYENYTKLQIREETSKTFGRKIKLMLCTNLLKDFIRDKNLKESDYLFDISPPYVNRYLKKLAKNIFGENKTFAGGKYSELTMYDFRHSAACYWLRKYPSEIGLKYRFGWKKTEQIHYYTELLGMQDDIKEEDLITDMDKTEMQKKMTNLEQEISVLKEELTSLKQYLRKYNMISIDIEKKVDTMKSTGILNMTGSK